jgi:hypothetical protein
VHALLSWSHLDRRPAPAAFSYLQIGISTASTFRLPERLQVHARAVSKTVGLLARARAANFDISDGAFKTPWRHQPMGYLTCPLMPRDVNECSQTSPDMKNPASLSAAGFLDNPGRLRM